MNYIREIVYLILISLGLFIFFLIIFDFSVSIACVSSEGRLYYNKLVAVCSFSDKHETIQNIEVYRNQNIEVYRDCYMNGNPINCSDIT